MISYLCQKLFARKDRKAISILSNILKLKTSNCQNSIKNYGYIFNFLYCRKIILNRPIRGEGGKIQNPKWVQIQRDSLSN